MQAIARTTRRIVGTYPALRQVIISVTPRERMRGATIRGCSPLDALVTYCDRHAWRIGLRGNPFGDPPAMHATIHASGDKTESLRVSVDPLIVEKRPLKCGANAVKYEGSYLITLEA
jgi:hypothetical protein